MNQSDYGFVFSALGALNVELSLVIVTVLWMAFFLIESSYSQGELLSSFDFSNLNLFVVSGIVLDLVGIALSLMGMLKG
jgi:hypothetical protein